MYASRIEEGGNIWPLLLQLATGFALPSIDHQYTSPYSPIPSCPSRGDTGCDPIVSPLLAQLQQDSAFEIIQYV